MKPGDKVKRMWKPQYGHGEIVHVLGNTVVVKWNIDNQIKLIFEEAKYLRKVE